MGSLGVGHDWETSLSLFTFMHWRRKWQPTPVFLPGESQGRGAWWPAVYGVAQCQTRLKRLSSSSSIWSFLCVYMCLVSLWVQFSLLVMLPVRLNTDSCLWPHFIWITSLKPFSTNIWHSEVLGLGYQHMNFERHRSAHGTLLSTFYQDSFCFFIFHIKVCYLCYRIQISLSETTSLIKFIQSDKYFY